MNLSPADYWRFAAVYAPRYRRTDERADVAIEERSGYLCTVNGVAVYLDLQAKDNGLSAEALLERLRGDDERL